MELILIFTKEIENLVRQIVWFDPNATGGKQ